MKNNYLLRSVSGNLLKVSVVLAGVLMSHQSYAQTGSRVSVADEKWQKDGMFGGYSPSQEILEKRNRTTKHFKNADGTFTAQIGADLHYLDASGSWQDVDYSIKPGTIAGFGFENTTNEIKSYFPAKAGNNSVVLQVPKGPSLSWWNSPELRITANGRELQKMAAASKDGSVSGKTIRYNDTYPGISEEFEVIQNGLENNIVLNSLHASLANKPASSVLEFSQVIKTKGDWDIVADGVRTTGNFTANMFSIKAPAFSEPLFFSPIVVFDKTVSRGEALFLASSPKEKLNAGQLATLAAHILVVQYHAEPVKDGLKITTRLPLSWLKASGRAYPVTIDPTVTIGATTTGNFYSPISHWYGYQRNADLYLQSEVGVYGAISAIEYYKTATATARTKPTKVYMRTTPATQLTGTDAWNSATYIGGLTALFDGTTTQDDAAGWKMITLTTPFNYTSDNLMVMVYDAYGGSGSTQYMALPAGTARQAAKRQDNTDPGDASATVVENYLPAIRITYTSGPPAITAVSTTSVCSNTGTFTITGTNFTGATAVTVGGAAVTSFVVNSDTQITVTAGAATSGVVEVTTSGGSASGTDTITVNPSPTVEAIAGGTASVCVGSSTPAFTNATDGGTWAVVNGTGSATIDAAGILTGATAGTVLVTYTVSDAECSTVASQSVTVNALPPALNVNGPAIPVCAGSIQQLTTTGGTMSATFVNEAFSGATLPTGWVAVAGAGDTVVVATTSTAGGAANEVVMTGNSQTASITDRLSYGPFNSTGLTSFNLQWNNYVRHYQATYNYSVKVQTSTDGTTWHDTSWGTSPVTANIGPGLATTTVSTADVGSSTLYIAFTLTGQTFGMYTWSIDDVLITGEIPADITWLPTTGLYTDAAATIPYTGDPAASIYTTAAVGVNYTATATNGSGCQVTATSNLDVVAVAAAPTADSPQTFTADQTVADLTVTGDDLTWYSNEDGTTVIPDTTPLEDGTTYYVSQTVNGCESPLTAILAQVQLSVGNPNAAVFSVYPNPVRNVLNFSNPSLEISKAEVFNVIGQCVLSKNIGSSQGQIDMTALAKGAYILRLSTPTSQKVVKVIKE